MMRTAPAHTPKMRAQGLVIDDLPDEVLVYDLETHQAHCLNQTAARVWRSCDGRTTPAQIAAQLSLEFNSPCSEEVVWFAIRQLERQHLLEQPVAWPPQFAKVTRRQVIRNLGLAAAIAVPVISSLVAPTAAEASTCVPTGQPCSTTIACCSVLGCNGMAGAGGVCN